MLSCLQLDVACTGQMLGDDACANPDTTLSPMNAIVPLLIPCVLHSPGAKESVLAAMVLQYVGLCATFEAPHDPRPFPIEPETAHMDTSRSRADACRWPTVLRSDEELNAVAQFVWETVTALHSNPPTGTISDPNNESINSTVSGGASRAHSQLHPLYAALLTGDPSALACHVLQRSNETLRTRAQMVLYCSAMNLVDSRCFVQQLQCQSPGSGGATNATAALHHDRDSGCESQPTLQHDTIASPSDPACRAGDDGAATGSTASLSLLFDVLLPRIVGVLASIMSDSCPGFAAGHSPGSTPSHATSPACLQQLLSAAYSALAQALKLSATLSARLPPQTASARLPGTLHRALDACWYGLVLADQGLAAEPWGLMDLLQNLVKALATVGHCPVSGTDARTVVGLRPDSRPHPGPSHTHAIPPHISCDAGRDPTASLNDPSSSTEGTALRRLASMALQLHARSPGPALALLQALLPHVGAQYIVRVCPGVAGKLLAPCVTSAEAATTCDFLAALMTEGGGRGPTDRVPDLSQLLQQIAHYMYWNAIEGLPETDEQQPAVPGPNPACPSPAGAFWRRASVLGKHLLRPLLRHDPMILEVLWIALVEMHASAVARFDVEATSVTTPSPDSPDTLPPPAAPSPTSASAHIAALDFSVLTSVTVLLHAATGVSGAAAFDHSLGGIAVPRGADSCASPAALDPVPRSVSTARQAVLHAATHHHWRLRLLAVDTLLQFVSPPTSKAVRKSRKAAKPPTTDAPAGGPPATDPRQVLVFACELMESAVPLMVDMDVNALPHRAQVLSALTKWLERLVVWRTCSGGAQTAVAGPQSSSDVCVPGAQGIRVTVCAHLHALSRVLQSAVVQAEHDRVCSLATQGLTKLWRLHGAYLRERAPGALPEWQWPSGGGLPEVEDPQCPQPLVSVLLQDLLLGIDNYATHTYALLTCLVPSPPGGCQTEPPGPAPDPMPGSRHAFEGPGGCSAERVRRTCAQALELLCSRRPETYVCGHMLLKLITEHMPYAVVLAFGGGDEGAVRSRAARSGSAPDAGESKGPRLGPAVSLDPPLNTETHGDRDPDSEELRVRLVLQPSHTERVLGLLDLGMDLIRAQLARHQRPSSREGPASEVGELDPRDRRGIIGGLSLLRSALDELVAAVGAPPGPGLATGLQRRLAERVRRLMALLGRLLAGEGCAVRVAGWGGTQGTAGAQAAQDLAAGVVVDWRALKEIAMLLRALVCGGATGLADALATESAAAPAPAPACQSPDSPAADPSQCPAPHSPTAACATEADLPCRGCPDGPAPGRHVYTAAAGLWCMRLLLSTAHSATVNQASQEVAHIAQALLAHPCPRVAALPEQWMHGLLGACGIRPPIPGPVALGHADPATAHDPQSDPQRGHSAGAPTVRDAGHGHAPFRLNSFPDSGSNPRSEPDPNPRPAGGPGLDAPRRTLPTLAFPDHSTVRRSSGLPFAFVALLGAEKRAARSAMLQLCLPRLMRAATDTGDACSTPGSSPARGDLPASPSAPGPASKAVHPDTVVHTLNILHFLVSDPVGWEVLRPSGDLLLQAGVRGFTAASYPLRNAATMLLCAVLSRTLSVDVKAGSGGEGDDVAKVEAGPDAGALLALHPALLEFLVETFCRQPTQTPSPTGASAAAPENSPSAPGPDPLCAPAPSQPSTRAPIPGPREPTASDAADSHFSALVLLCRLSSPLPPVRFSPGAAPGPTEPRGGRVARALEAIFGALNRDFAQRTWFERKVMATVRAVLHTIEPPDPTPRATPPEPAQARPGAPPVPQSRYIARLAHTLTAQLQSRNNNAIHGVLLQLLVLLQSLAHPLAGTSAPFGPDAEPVVALPPLLPTTTAEQVVEAVLHLCHWVRALSEVQMADARLWQPPGVSPVCVAAWLQLIGQLVGLFVRVLSVHRALSTGVHQPLGGLPTQIAPGLMFRGRDGGGRVQGVYVYAWTPRPRPPPPTQIPSAHLRPRSSCSRPTAHVHKFSKHCPHFSAQNCTGDAEKQINSFFGNCLRKFANGNCATVPPTDVSAKCPGPVVGNPSGVTRAESLHNALKSGEGASQTGSKAPSVVGRWTGGGGGGKGRTLPRRAVDPQYPRAGGRGGGASKCFGLCWHICTFDFVNEPKWIVEGLRRLLRLVDVLHKCVARQSASRAPKDRH